jgi:hypothetical protein
MQNMFNFVQNYRVIFSDDELGKKLLSYIWVKIVPYTLPLKLALLSCLMFIHDLDPCNLKFSISVNIHWY